MAYSSAVAHIVIVAAGPGEELVAVILATCYLICSKPNQYGAREFKNLSTHHAVCSAIDDLVVDGFIFLYCSVDIVIFDDFQTSF